MSTLNEMSTLKDESISATCKHAESCCDFRRVTGFFDDDEDDALEDDAAKATADAFAFASVWATLTLCFVFERAVENKSENFFC